MLRKFRRSIDKARKAFETGPERYVGVPAEQARWMPAEEFERTTDLPRDARIQMTGCAVTGAIWVKPLAFPYEGFTEDKLRELLEERRQVVRAAGGQGPDGDGPLHVQLEMLDNIIEFHAAPPCGCPPSIGIGPPAVA